MPSGGRKTQAGTWALDFLSMALAQLAKMATASNLPEVRHGDQSPDLLYVSFRGPLPRRPLKRWPRFFLSRPEELVPSGASYIFTTPLVCRSPPKERLGYKESVGAGWRNSSSR